MPRIPKKAQPYVDRLNGYEESSGLLVFDLIHIYPTNKFGVNHDSFYDSRLSTIVLFNYNRRAKRTFESKAGIFFEGVTAKRVGVFADGSTIVVPEDQFKVLETQDMLYLSPA